MWYFTSQFLKSVSNKIDAPTKNVHRINRSSMKKKRYKRSDHFCNVLLCFTNFLHWSVSNKIEAVTKSSNVLLLDLSSCYKRLEHFCRVVFTERFSRACLYHMTGSRKENVLSHEYFQGDY